MPTIRPMADLRDTGKISELCCQKNEPVFIAKNGSGHPVVMSMDTYDKQMGLLDVYSKLAAAEKQYGGSICMRSACGRENCNMSYVYKLTVAVRLAVLTDLVRA